MSTHNIQFHDKIRKNPLIFVFLCYQKNFAGTQERVRIIHCKRAIDVRAIEVWLYNSSSGIMFLYLYVVDCNRALLSHYLLRKFNFTFKYMGIWNWRNPKIVVRWNDFIFVDSMKLKYFANTYDLTLPAHERILPSRKHTYIILTPLNPTFI